MGSFLALVVLLGLCIAAQGYAPTCSSQTVDVVNDHIRFVANGSDTYPPNLNCSWLYTPPSPNDLLVFNFSLYNTEYYWDHLSILDSDMNLVWQESGFRPTPMIVVAPGPWAYMIFTSDGSAAPYNAGFEVNIHALSRPSQPTRTVLPLNQRILGTLESPQWRLGYTIDVPESAYPFGVKIDFQQPPPTNYFEFQTFCSTEEMMSLDILAYNPARQETITATLNPSTRVYSLQLPPNSSSGPSEQWEYTVVAYGRLAMSSKWMIATTTSDASMDICPTDAVMEAPTGHFGVSTMPRCGGAACVWEVTSVPPTARIAFNVTNLPMNFYGLYLREDEMIMYSTVLMSSNGQRILTSWSNDVSIMSQINQPIFNPQYSGLVSIDYTTVPYDDISTVPTWPADTSVQQHTAVNLTFPGYSHTFKVRISESDIGTSLSFVYTTDACSPDAMGSSSSSSYQCESRLFAKVGEIPTLETADVGNWGEVYGPLVSAGNQQHITIEITEAMLTESNYVYVSLWGGRSGWTTEEYQILFTRGSLGACLRSSSASTTEDLVPGTDVSFTMVPVLISRCVWAFRAPIGRRISVSATPRDAYTTLSIVDGPQTSSTSPVELWGQWQSLAAGKPVLATTSGADVTITLITQTISFESGVDLIVSVLPDEPTTSAGIPMQDNVLRLDSEKNTTGRATVSFPQSLARVTVWCPGIDNQTALHFYTDMWSSYGVLYYLYGGDDETNTASATSHTLVSRMNSPRIIAPTKRGYHHYLYEHFRAYAPTVGGEQVITFDATTAVPTTPVTPWTPETVNVLQPCGTVSLDLLRTNKGTTPGRNQGMETRFVVHGAAMHPSAVGVDFIVITPAYATSMYAHMGLPMESENTQPQDSEWDDGGRLNYYTYSQGLNLLRGTTRIIGDMEQSFYGLLHAVAIQASPWAKVIALPVFDKPLQVDWEAHLLREQQVPHLHCVSEFTGMSVFRVCPPASPAVFKISFSMESSDRVSVYMKYGSAPTMNSYHEAVSLIPAGETIVISPDASEWVTTLGSGNVEGGCDDNSAMFVGLVDMQDAQLPGQTIDPNRQIGEPGVGVKVSFEAVLPSTPAPSKKSNALPVWGVVVIAFFAVVSVVLSVMLVQTWRRWKTEQGKAARAHLVVDGVELGRVKYDNLDDDKPALPGAAAGVAASAVAVSDLDESVRAELAVLRELRKSHPDIVQAAAATLGEAAGGAGAGADDDASDDGQL